MRQELIEEIGVKLLGQYPDTGEAALRNLKKWISGEPPFVPAAALRDFVENAPLDLIHESFWRSCPFGTGGVRGTVGFGPNRINPTVVALTIQAHCDFIDRFLSSNDELRVERAVVIANDVRKFLDAARTLKFLADNPYQAANPFYGASSRSLAYLSAEVYAANGFIAYMLSPGDSDALLTTPELSFLIRWLRSSGGINLSASHNHPDDNGIKVYDENGGQYLPPRDEELTRMAEQIRHVNHIPYDEAVTTGFIRDIPAEALHDYMSLYLDRARNRGLRSERNTKILFTPLSGCGERTVRHALEALDYSVHVPRREGPDGTFAAIPLLAPNPEVKEATDRAKVEAQHFGAKLVLATDPDGDRLGAEVLHNDEWRHLTGNQIATILGYFLFLDPNGPELRGAVYATIVTTLAVRAIAERAGCQHIVDNLLVGFKYIGEAVHHFSNNLGKGADDSTLLAFAAEESHGYLDTPQLRDKDAMSGAMYLARLHEDLTASGRTLIDYLASAYDVVGQFGDRGRSIVILGSAGVRAIQKIMNRLRQTKLRSLGGVNIEETIDYWSESEEGLGPIRSSTDREARNVIVYKFTGGRITLRPSGTEPKLKFYVQTSGSTSWDGAQGDADRLSDAVYRDLLLLMGHDLDRAIASLPDVIPLDGKLEMQDRILPEFHRLLATDDKSTEFLASWLKDRVSALIPGESSWEIVVPALRSIVDTWDEDLVTKVRGVLT